MQVVIGSASLSISNRISEIPRMSDWLCAEIAKLDVPDEQSQTLQFKFDLCANEAITNIISYAYDDGGAHQITLNLSQRGNLIKLDISDDGAMFNPLDKPEHQRPATLEEADIGGLGIDLIRHYMDLLEYARIDETNVLSIGAFIAGG